jgi:hypothetical protein
MATTCAASICTRQRVVAEGRGEAKAGVGQVAPLLEGPEVVV